MNSLRFKNYSLRIWQYDLEVEASLAEVQVEVQSPELVHINHEDPGDTSIMIPDVTINEWSLAYPN